MKKIIVCAISLLMLAWAAVALGQEWTVDTIHSGIRFGVKHVFSTVWGEFSDFEGKILFDPDNLDQSAFDFTIKVNSINTFNEKRDIHLRSDDFFAAATYPTMGFRSSEIHHRGGSHYTVIGTMRIKETRRRMEIPFTYHGTVLSPFNNKDLLTGFDSEFTLNRLEFGVGTGKFFNQRMVGDKVRVLISVEAVGKN